MPSRRRLCAGVGFVRRREQLNDGCQLRRERLHVRQVSSPGLHLGALRDPTEQARNPEEQEVASPLWPNASQMILCNKRLAEIIREIGNLLRRT